MSPSRTAPVTVSMAAIQLTRSSIILCIHLELERNWHAHWPASYFLPFPPLWPPPLSFVLSGLSAAGFGLSWPLLVCHQRKLRG
jgi:hypothetical protein